MSHVVPSRGGAQYISHVSHVFGFSTSLPTSLVTRSLLLAAPVHGDIGLPSPRVLIEFLWWTVVIASRISSKFWWMCDMASGTVCHNTDAADMDSSVGRSVPCGSRGSGVTLHSDELYDLDISIINVIGLRTWQPEAAVVQVMSIPDNCCVWIVIADENVGHEGFHEGFHEVRFCPPFQITWWV